MNIILVGLPGAGKSTFGKRLAHRLSLDFFDLDDLIVTSQQKSINQIFSEQGEEVFRNIEHQTLSNFCEQHDHYLLSTGGGTPCFRDNMSLIKSVGYSIFLNPPLEIIIERVSNNDKRPLLAGEDAAVKLIESGVRTAERSLKRDFKKGKQLGSS